MTKEPEIDRDGHVIGLSKDAQVRMFQDPHEITMIPGETALALVARVEDVKVHPGEYGQLQITNIRLIWFFPRAANVNISIGYRAITSHTISSCVSNGANQTEVLLIRCQEGNKTYEFIFNAAKSEQSVFRFFEMALKNYEASPLLREQKLRSSLIREGNLVLLQDEQVMIHMDGVANFSGEVAKIGTAIVTNYRFVWYSEIVSNFNVSIPLILLPELKVIRSKRFGKCLYLKICSGGSNYMYGFTIQPEEKLVEFTNSLEKIRAGAARMPTLTPPLKIQSKVVEQPPPIVDEDLELLDNEPGLRYLPCDTVAASDAAAVFDKALGLAIEALPEDETISEKWKKASESPLPDLEEDDF